MNHGWEKKRLGDVCDIYQPQTISTKDLVENGQYDVFGANGIIGKYSSYNHEEPEVLLTCRGATCGTINVSNPKSWINGNAMVIHPISDELLKSYLHIAMMAVDYSGVITGAAQPQITRISLSPVVISIPPVEKQSQIVSELDKLNELIELKRNQLKDLDTLAQSLFYETFGDPIDNPKGWESILLEECVNDNCPISYGIVQPGDDVANGTPLVRPVDFGANRCVFNENLKHVSPSISESYKRTILKGDEILICVRGTTGLVKLSHTSLRGANVTRGIVPIQIKSQLSKIYIYEYLKRERAQSYIQSYTKGIALKQINLSDLRSLPILLPPVSLQNEFAEKIEAIEKQKRLIESSIIDLETLLASRMDYWFND